MTSTIGGPDLLAELAVEVANEGPVSFGVHNDANLSMLDQLYGINQPFPQFPRLDAMEESERQLVHAVAERHLDLHHTEGDDPGDDTDGAAPDDLGAGTPTGTLEPLAGPYLWITALRRDATMVVRLLGATTSAEVCIHTGGSHKLALASVSTADTASDGYGYVDLTVLSADDLSGRLQTFILDEAGATAWSWTRTPDSPWREVLREISLDPERADAAKLLRAGPEATSG